MKLNLGVELKKKLASSAPRLNLPWLTKSGVTPVIVGSDANAPQGFGPTPRPWQDAPGMADRGGPFAPKPIPGVAQHDIPRLDPRHDPQSALDAIRAMVRRASNNT
jgi:hypothetical protein